MDQSPKTDTDILNGIQASEGNHNSPANVHSQHMNEAELHEQNMGTTIAAGQDDAGDVVGEFSLPHRILLEPAEPSNPSMADHQTNDSSNDSGDEFLNVPMPVVTAGPSTFAYQWAWKNRIRSDKLARDCDYDIRAFTPTFVHDCLMLPGSLANVLGKGSAEQIIHRMTPALLPGFHAHIHVETEQPCLIQSGDSHSYVQGMLIFGEGKDGREQIHRHYRPHAKRIKLQVEIEIAVPVPSEERRHRRERWVLQRKRLWAHAWLWANVREFESQFRPDSQDWKLEEYLGGKYAMHQAMRVQNGIGEDYDLGEEPDGKQAGDDNAEVDDDMSWVPEPEAIPQETLPAQSQSLDPDQDQLAPREVPYGSPGGFSWERRDDAIGRW